MTPSRQSPLLRRVWLPRWLYEALPWLYLLAGGAALVGGLFGSPGGWYYPYLALLGLGTVHAGLWVAMARYRWRRRRIGRMTDNHRPADTTSLHPVQGS